MEVDSDRIDRLILGLLVLQAVLDLRAFRSIQQIQRLLVGLDRLAFLVDRFRLHFLVVHVVLASLMVPVDLPFLGQCGLFLVFLAGRGFRRFRRVPLVQLVLVGLVGRVIPHLLLFRVLQPFLAIPLVLAFLVDRLLPVRILDSLSVVDVEVAAKLPVGLLFLGSLELHHDQADHQVLVVQEVQRAKHHIRSSLLDFQSEKQQRRKVWKRQILLGSSLRIRLGHHILLDELDVGGWLRELVF